ncbi:MAG: O-acetyl-ADP-ribose deacetylase [Deltaproteobacteria bacterium]|nr:O-acetyl-ADP-ribose deacetylase [Deltaproteobacteria bacterium]
MRLEINGCAIELIRGDITLEATGAIVNAANSRLAGGGGVDGAIHRVGGPAIMDECRKIGGCPTGSAVITTGGNLKAGYVIHTVGPVYRDGAHNEPTLLANAYRESLSLALSKGIKTISFPSISTGTYGYPAKAASEVALKTILAFVKAHTGLTLVRFVLFSDADLKTYSGTLLRLV